MSEKETPSGDAGELRRRAEEMDRGEAALAPENLEGLSPEETRRTLHELRVQQIELEMQNEELRRAQAELDAARARYFDLYDLAPVGYCTVSKEGLILEANLTAAGMLGVARGALVQQRLTNFILREDEDLYYRHRKQLFETGEPQSCDLRMVEMDGTAFWARLEATTGEDAGGEPVGRVVIGDITARKRTDEALRESEQRYRSLFEHMLDGLAYCQMLYDDRDRPVDFVYLEVNRAFEQLTGLRDVVGKRVSEVVPGIRESSPELFEIYNRVALTGKPESFEFEFKLNSQWLKISVYSPGKGYFAAVFDDITERKLNEADREAMVALLRLANASNDTRELIRTVTAEMQGWSGCEAVGIRLQEGDKFPYYETRGFPAQFVQAEDDLCARDANQELLRDSQGNAVLECMCGNILCGRFDPRQPFFTPGGSFWTNSTSQLLASTTEADRQAHTRNRCNREGFESVALIPLRCSGQTLGLLQFNDPRPGRFTPEKIALMERAAASLAIALEQRRTQAALRESEEKYRMVADFTFDWEYWISPTREMRYVSPSCLRVTGYSAGQFLGDPGFLPSIIHPDDQIAYERHMCEVLAADCNPGLVKIEFRVIASDGNVRWISHSCQSVFGTDGTWLGRRAGNRDITRRKRADEALRESEERYRSILNASPDAIVIADLEGRIRMVSLVTLTMFGCEREEKMLGHLITDFIVPEDRDRGWSNTVLMYQGVMGPNEYRGLRPDGSTFDFEVKSEFIRDLEGQPTSIVFVVRDITQRKRAQEERETLEAQLIQAQRMESIGRLAGGVAHDFNNLLTVINGYSQMLLGGLSADDPLRADLAEIYNAGERAAGLTRQLLAFSRKQILQLRRLDVNRVVEEMRPMLERLVGEDVEVRVALHAESGTVHADPHQLEQVIMNLAVNALDAMPGGGKLLIETARVERDESHTRSHPEARAGCYVMLAVSDNGVGMDGETRRHIFEPFFTTKAVGKGTGLGLSMVQGIVAQSGGYISVYSEPGQGTSFKIYLPALAEAAADDWKPAAVPVLGGKETVLVVEDQAEVRQYAVAVLKAYGYRVIPAENAGEALLLRARERGRIDLVLTDVVMPNVSGRELADRLETLQPGIKVLFMSGYTGNVIEQHRVLEKGAEYIQKPFSPEELARKVRAVLGPPAPPARILVADDEAGVRGFLRAVLEDGGYEVTEAADGKQALREALAGRVDLVITDLVMPEQEGIETIKALRRDVPGVGIIAISGAFEGQFLKTALLLGADAGLSKPVSAELLLASVAEVLKSRR